MRILGLSGSLRRESHNTSLLRVAAMSLPPGIELELYDGLGDRPRYNADIDGASTGLFGAVWAQAEVRKVLKTIGADVLDGELPVAHAHVAFGDDGHLADAGTRDALDELVAVLSSRAGAAEVVAN